MTDKDPLQGLRIALGVELPPPPVYFPILPYRKCRKFLPYANRERNPTCVRCGKPLASH